MLTRAKVREGLSHAHAGPPPSCHGRPRRMRGRARAVRTAAEVRVQVLVDKAGGALNQIYEMYVNNNAAVGASGAIYGLLLGFGMLFPNVELMLIFLPIPIKAKYFIPILMVVELFLGVNQFSWDNIAHFAHLGGALFGFLLVLYWKKTGVGLR